MHSSDTMEISQKTTPSNITPKDQQKQSAEEILDFIDELT